MKSMDDMMIGGISGRNNPVATDSAATNNNNRINPENNLPGMFFAQSMTENGYTPKERADELVLWVLSKMSLERHFNIWPVSEGIIPNNAPLDSQNKRWFITQYLALKTIRNYVDNYTDNTGKRQEIIKSVQ